MIKIMTENSLEKVDNFVQAWTKQLLGYSYCSDLIDSIFINPTKYNACLLNFRIVLYM